MASRLVSVAGASSCFERSYVTYSDRAKAEELLVSLKTLQQWTAVSSQTAMEMAAGALKRADADIALSVTGYAGPDSGSGEEVGLVYIGCATKNNIRVKECHLKGNRTEIRERAAEEALRMAEEMIKSFLSGIPKKC